jgi:hypothetical protein
LISLLNNKYFEAAGLTLLISDAQNPAERGQEIICILELTNPPRILISLLNNKYFEAAGLTLLISDAQNPAERGKSTPYIDFFTK